MAQAIITYCDQHLTRDEHVLGETWEVALGAPGARPATYKLDACEECAKPLRELLEYLAELGVRVPKKQARASLDTAPAHAPRPDPGAGVTTGIQCTRCAYVGPSRSHLSSHARQVHETSIAELLGEPTPFSCPTCGQAFGKSAGLQRHLSSHPELVESGG